MIRSRRTVPPSPPRPPSPRRTTLTALHGLLLLTSACSASEPTALDVDDPPSSRPTVPPELVAPVTPQAGAPDDATAASCPEGTELVLGTVADDYLHATLPQSQVCMVGDLGHDRIHDETRDRGWLMGGPGNDTIIGSPGGAMATGNEGDDSIETMGANDEIYGGDGRDVVHAGGGNDYVEGNEGGDVLYGEDGRDRLLGNDGNDELYGGAGDDALLGGAGSDIVKGGDGDDFAAVLHTCQLGAGEVLDGGPGVDVLLSPLNEHELQLMGVTVVGFETVVKLPADAFGCDPASCTCPDAFAAHTEVDPCDFGFMAGTPDVDPDALRAACEDFVTSIPQVLATLPPEPTQSDFEAAITSDPMWLGTFEQLGVLAHGHTPGEANAEFPGTPTSPGTPQPGVLQGRDACDRPDEPLSIQIAVDGINNCTADEEALVADRVDLASFLRWRMDQQLRPIVEEPDPVTAAAMWEQGDFRYAMDYWFGEYDADRAATALQTVDEIWDALHADDGAEHVQCYHPLTWWQGALLAAFSPPTLMHKTHLNMCFLSEHTEAVNAIAHATFAAPTSPSSAVLYPPNSIELCEQFFDDYDPNDAGDQSFQATVIMHELLHWTFNDEGMLRDFHGTADDGICPNTGCVGPDIAHDLAELAPDVAVKNIHNYNEWAHVVAGAYLEGYCDDVWGAPCSPSDCCGNGQLDLQTGEVCDEGDFGEATCLTESGLTEGALSCASDCSAIDAAACFGSCGNGAIDPALGEACDEADFGDVSCADYGNDMGSLSCTEACTIDTSGCTGGLGPRPAGYGGCGLDPSYCENSPEDCHTWGDAGNCAGGPCLRTDPSNRVGGQLDPNADFHPKGDFRDELGNLHRCEPIDGQETTCVDEGGWGVCRKCGAAEGESMRGCSCSLDEDCWSPQETLYCYGGQFPGGGFCWPLEGPPQFQCEEGACGQAYGEGGGSYCEHYPEGGPNARCQPQWCADMQAELCTGEGVICTDGFDGSPDDPATDCQNECELDEDCSPGLGWPPGYGCVINGNNGTCAPL